MPKRIPPFFILRSICQTYSQFWIILKGKPVSNSAGGAWTNFVIGFEECWGPAYEKAKIPTPSIHHLAATPITWFISWDWTMVSSGLSSKKTPSVEYGQAMIIKYPFGLVEPFFLVTGATAATASFSTPTALTRYKRPLNQMFPNCSHDFPRLFPICLPLKSPLLDHMSMGQPLLWT